MQAIEIFRPGTWTAKSGDTVSFGAEDLQAAADAYDPEVHEAPIVVGHPSNDAPAYGWVSGLSFAEDRLSATPHQVDPDFADLVKAGRFKKVSAAFYRPDAPNNPTPGVFYLRHVGMLGAQAPAVKGLRNAEFAADEDGIIVFGDFTDRMAASVFRSLREWVIEKFSLEDADRAVPGHMVDVIQEQAVIPDEGPPGFSEPAAQDVAADNTAEEPDVATNDDTERDAEAQAQRDTEFTERENAHAAEVRRFRSQQAEARVDRLIDDGRVPPGYKPGLVAFMASLAEGDTLEFSETEGDGARKMSPRAFFEAFLETLPTQVDFSERSGEDGSQRLSAVFTPPDGYAVDPARLELHEKALAYQEQHSGVAYIEAVAAVS